MAKYDAFHFSPPAPFADVTLLNPESGLKQTNVPMLLDTGADVTLIPKLSAENLDLDLYSLGQVELAGFNNSKSLVQIVYLHLVFAEKTFRGEYFLIEQDFGIIGRNILNLLKIEFDGNNLSWKVI